ncbi:MAG: SulP family inorganic anion transporter [Nitrospirales bacterium]|nr:SulP family inorganic anion transporter [Nitrospirales bacterium]
MNWHSTKEYLADFNPWPRIRTMGTNIRQDILSGVTVAFVALPLALGFGVASGLGAITGLWGAVAGGIVGGLFGGSHVGVSGPTGPKTVQLAVVMHDHILPNGEPDLVFAFGIVFFSGLIMIAIAMLKMGRFIYLTPYSVISGFMCGIGAIVIIIELNPFLGLPVHSSVRDALLSIPYSLMHVHFDALLVSSLTLGTILIWPKITNALWLPSPLVGLMVGTLVASGLNLNIEYIPTVPVGLPELYWPTLTQMENLDNPLAATLSRLEEMLAPAAALAGLAIYDSLLTCVVIDQMSEERHNSDQEIFGQGMANMAAGLIGGLTTATATMRSVANIKCGARTILSTIVHGLVLLALVLGLAPLASYIPMAALAGILMKVGYDILDFRVFPILRRMPTGSKITFWTVFFLTVWVDLLVAVGIGLAMAFFLFVKQMSEISNTEVVGLNQTQQGSIENIPVHLKQRISILQPEGPLFFGIADTLYRQVDRLVHYDVLIISLDRVPLVDLSGALSLEDLILLAQKRDTKIILKGLNSNVRRVLTELGILKKIELKNVVDNFETALTMATNHIGLRHFSKSEFESQSDITGVSPPQSK